MRKPPYRAPAPKGVTPTSPQPFDPATIPPLRRAIAMIGREVRTVEWLPTPPVPLPPPRPTYHGPAQWGDEENEE